MFVYGIFFTLKHYPEKSSFYFPFFGIYSLWYGEIFYYEFFLLNTIDVLIDDLFKVHFRSDCNSNLELRHW